MDANSYDRELKELQELLNRVPKNSDNPDDIIAKEIFTLLIEQRQQKLRIKTRKH